MRGSRDTRFAGLRPACRPEVGVPGRFCHHGTTAHRPLRACGPRADRRSAFQAACATRGSSLTRSAGLRPACRPEVGVPGRGCHARMAASPEVRAVRLGRVTTCAARSAARAGLKTGGPSRRVVTEAGRSEPGAPCGGGARRAVRACGPRAGLKAPTGRLASGPSRHAITEAGAFQPGASSRRSGGWWFVRSRDLAEQAYATAPAGGGLCRLKPAFQAGGAMPAWRRSRRCAT